MGHFNSVPDIIQCYDQDITKGGCKGMLLEVVDAI